jgi:hypothetical protein
MMPGFTPEGCISNPVDLDLPDKKTSDDPLKNSNFLNLLEHDGVPFRIEHKKQILRDNEIKKKREAGNAKSSIVILRSYKPVYEKDANAVVTNPKKYFEDAQLKSKVKRDE